MNPTRFTAIGVTLLTALSLLAAPALSQEPPDPTDPASISAPPSPEPVLMGCVDGQVDVNGSVSDLANLDKADGGSLSRPVRQRIVDGQPYLQPSDLLAVSGVTSNDVAAWAAADLVCATPPLVVGPDGSSVPDYLGDVCPADGSRVDVNDPSSRRALQAMFGRPTGDRIVDGQPYPHVTNALRVAGFGPGRDKKHADELCATPYPIAFDGTDWAWLSPAGGTVNGPDGAALVVPAGTVTGTGLWGSVTLTDVDDLRGGPMFDMHVHGPWAGDGRLVKVVLPADSYAQEAPAGWEPTVVHYDNPDDPEVHFGTAVEATGTTVAAAVTSLSELRAIQQPSANLAFTVVIVPNTKLLEDSIPGYGAAPSHTADAAQCSPDATAVDRDVAGVEASPDRLLSSSVGLRPNAATCLQGTPSAESMTSRTTNTSGLAYTYRTNFYSNVGSRASVTYTPQANLFMEAWLRVANRNAGDDRYGVVAGPGTVMDMRIPVTTGTGNTRVEVDYNEGATMSMAILARLSAFEELGALPGFVECLTGDGVSFGRVLQCAETASETLSDDNPLKRKLKGLVRAVNVFDVSRQLYESVAAALGRTEGTVYIYFRAEDPPTEDARGRAVLSACLVRTGAYYAVDGECQDRFYANGGGAPGGGSNPTGGLDGTIVTDSGPLVLHSVGTATRYLSYDGRLAEGIVESDGEYGCFAARFLLRDWLPYDKVVDYHTQETVHDGCPEDIAVLPPLTANATNWILREANGTAWLIDGQSRIRWIPDGQVYRCLAQRFYVRDHVDYGAQIAQFESDNYAGDATCS